MLFGEDGEDGGGDCQLERRESGPAEAEAGPDSAAATEAGAGAKADGEDPAEAHTENDSETSGEGKGHGRNGADDFSGAEKIEVRHESLQPGDPCPNCEKGTLYDTRRPGVLVRLVGQAPVKAMVYYLQKLRCNPCGAILHRQAAGGCRSRGEV